MKIVSAFAVGLALALCGCAQADRIDLTTVLSNGNCQTSAIGVREIDYTVLAAYRGTRLLDMSQSNEAEAHPVRLVAIASGDYPTPGYSLAIDSEPKLQGNELTIAVKLSKPAPDAILAQMITRPCLVVGIADPRVVRVRVVGDSDRSIGELTLAPKAP
jgi:PrcB C-terminal